MVNACPLVHLCAVSDDSYDLLYETTLNICSTSPLSICCKARFEWKCIAKVYDGSIRWFSKTCWIRRRNNSMCWVTCDIWVSSLVHLYTPVPSLVICMIPWWFHIFHICWTLSLFISSNARSACSCIENVSGGSLRWSFKSVLSKTCWIRRWNQCTRWAVRYVSVRTCCPLAYLRAILVIHRTYDDLTCATFVQQRLSALWIWWHKVSIAALNVWWLSSFCSDVHQTSSWSWTALTQALIIW